MAHPVSQPTLFDYAAHRAVAKLHAQAEFDAARADVARTQGASLDCQAQGNHRAPACLRHEAACSRFNNAKKALAPYR